MSFPRDPDSDPLDEEAFQAFKRICFWLLGAIVLIFAVIIFCK